MSNELRNKIAAKTVDEIRNREICKFRSVTEIVFEALDTYAKELRKEIDGELQGNRVLCRKYESCLNVRDERIDVLEKLLEKVRWQACLDLVDWDTASASAEFRPILDAVVQHLDLLVKMCTSGLSDGLTDHQEIIAEGCGNEEGRS